MVETIVFGGGCFWCTEAIFEQLRGVISATSGYAGGNTTDPTYEQVSRGDTGHAEVIQIEYHPDEISTRDLLTVFFASHDPTTINRQGADVGPQYRSIILYKNEAQKDEVKKYITELKNQDIDIVTEIKPLEVFYPAEESHQQFYERNPDQSYTQAVINPKLEKVRREFKKLVKKHL